MPADPGSTAERYDVVIVGGGAAGVLVAIALLAGDAPAPRVAIVEPAQQLGEGAAYATTDPHHLLNVPASRMGAIAERPEHFLDFLSARDGASRAQLAASFAPRRDYAHYLRATLDSMPGRDALTHLRAQVEDITPDDGGWRVQLSNAVRLRASQVVLAIGNAPRPLPGFLLHPGVRMVEAWDYAGLAAVPDDADVCILGSGLSMVDAALALDRPPGRRRGRILVLSRHGLLPLAHAPGAPQREDSLDEWLPLGLRARMRLLRRRVRTAAAAGEPWQWTLDRLRPHGQALWQSLDPPGQRRFLRHVVRYWDIHRHRLAPQVAARIGTMRAGGQLDAVAGRLRAISAHPDGGSAVRYRPRGKTHEHSWRADWIVNASGVETSIELRPGRLLQAMRGRGLALPGRHGLGLAGSDDGRVLDSRGRPIPGLFVIGALRIGDLWESIAIPELRQQARQIATAIRAG